MFIYADTYMYIYVYIYTNIDISFLYTLLNRVTQRLTTLNVINIYIHICICAYIYIYIYVYTHIQIYLIYMHVEIRYLTERLTNLKTIHPYKEPILSNETVGVHVGDVHVQHVVEFTTTCWLLVCMLDYWCACW